MTSRLCFILLLASQPLMAQQQPLQGSPVTGSLQEGARPALLTSTPVNQVLPADSAFGFSAFAAAPDSILLHWDIQPGYYLYRKSIALVDANGHTLALTLPPAREITDEYFGTVEVYYDSLDVQAAVTASTTDGTLRLQLEYQGCAEALYCYPPQQKQIELTLP